MNTFDFCDKLLDLFYKDTTGIKDYDRIDEWGLVELLNVTEKANCHIRTEDIDPELFDTEKIPFVAFYFADTGKTKNYMVKKGILRIDIYTSSSNAYIAKYIRKRIVNIMHRDFDEWLVAEGQRSSGVCNIYKYRLEFSPLVID